MAEYLAMATSNTPKVGFFERALGRPVRRRPVAQRIEEPRETLDLSNSARGRYAEAGEIASGGWHTRDWGLGVGVLGDDYDYATQHAATIRTIARFGLHENRPAAGPLPAVQAPIDEFDFAAYPHGVRTWTEDHPAWWQRSRRVR